MAAIATAGRAYHCGAPRHEVLRLSLRHAAHVWSSLWLLLRADVINATRSSLAYPSGFSPLLH